MKSLLVNNTAVDLAAQNAPFLSNYSVVVLNFSGGALTLQESDDGVNNWTTLAAAGVGATNVTLNKQYVRVSTSANLFLVGN